MKPWTILVLFIVIGSSLISGATAATWSYTSANVSSPWVCPAGVGNVTVELIGGGGSGRGGQSVLYAGGGGFAGQHYTYAKIPVTPGSSYTISVGAGGATSAYNAVSNAGGSTTGFGKTATGGLGGEILPTNGDGGAGAAGFKVTTRLAVNGTGSDGRLGGVSGLGYGAAGGGGSHDSSPAYDTSGGAGASGLIVITDYADYAGNTPDFSADDTSISYGTLVTFTDLSTITESTDLSYNWSFGDGEYSSTIGTVKHVYSYMGSFDVTLNITSSGGSITETKTSYINAIAQPNELDLKSEPKPVQFHVQTFLGAPLVNANVTIQGIQTSTGNWDWIPLLLGIPLDEVALGNTSMSQTTDSLGNVEFLMVPTVKYNVSTVLSGYTFQPFYIIPHEERYTLAAVLNTSEFFGVPAGKSNITVTVSGTKINSTHGRVNLSLIDTASSVTGGRVSIYKKNATPGGDDVYITSMQISGSSYVNNSTVLSLDDKGTEFIVHTDAGSSLESANITIDKIVGFMANPVQVGWFTAQLTLWFAMGILILVALSSGASGSPQVMAVDCILAWLFYGIGWLNPIVDSYGNTAVIGTLSLALFMVVVWLFAEGKRAER